MQGQVPPSQQPMLLLRDVTTLIRQYEHKVARFLMMNQDGSKMTPAKYEGLPLHQLYRGPVLLGFLTKEK